MADVIQKGYGQKTVKKLRKLEKMDYQLSTQIDQEFLISRSNNPADMRTLKRYSMNVHNRPEHS